MQMNVIVNFMSSFVKHYYFNNQPRQVVLLYFITNIYTHLFSVVLHKIHSFSCHKRPVNQNMLQSTIRYAKRYYRPIFGGLLYYYVCMHGSFPH